MTNLINKLNVLVKSSMNSVLGNDTSPSARRGRSASQRLGKDIDQDIAARRDQIDRALNAEDRLMAEIAALQREIDDWDHRADQALTQGDEAGARHAIRQMQRQQQRAGLLESDLAQHRISTSELIQRVNELEAIVAEARRHAESAPAEEDDTRTGETLSDRLRHIRQQVTDRTPEPAPEVVDSDEFDAQAVEDDLARRRARLSQ